MRRVAQSIGNRLTPQAVLAQSRVTSVAASSSSSSSSPSSHSRTLSGIGIEDSERRLPGSGPFGRGVGAGVRSMGTFSGQKDLPSLPLPSLEHTFGKYLDTVRPHLSASEVKEVEALATAALADPNVRIRQAQLQTLRASRPNWLDPMWMPFAYLQWRAALPINSNVTGYLFGEHRKRWQPALAAAALAHGALQYHIQMLHGEVAVNTDRNGTPQCMDQYSRMFSLTRVPGEVEDQLVKFHSSESKHIVVTAARWQYVIAVIDAAGALLPLPMLHASMREVLADARARGPAEHPIAALTGTERTKWAKVRNRMVTQEHNAAALSLVESAVFAVSLEAESDPNPEPEPEPDPATSPPGSSGSKSSGSGSSGASLDAACAMSCFVGDGRSTWFDKSFTIKVSGADEEQNSNPSIHIEHSWADAPVPLGLFFNHALPYAEAAAEDEAGALAAAQAAQPAPWNRVDFALDDELRRDVAAATADVLAAKADSDVAVHRCTGLGKPVWKAAKLSPDAAVQMGMQLAWRRLTGAERPPATYETIGMTGWRNGRTETCRVVSVASEAFVAAALALGADVETGGDEQLRAEAERTLRAACDAHVAYIVQGQKGEGIDRHMFGLKVMADGGPQPAVFEHRAFAASGGTGEFVLSTSNNSYIPRPFGGLFGASVPDGYGVCYIPAAGEVTLCVEGKRSSEAAGSLRFAQEVERAIRDVAAIAGVHVPHARL